MQISTSTGTSEARDKNIPVFPSSHKAAFALVCVLFFLWGMSNNLTDILVQQFRKSFELSPFGAQLVQTANFFGYFVMSMPAAFVMRRWGYKTGMVMGLLLFGGGMLMFWPAAVSGLYAPFLVALFAVGMGAATLETAANPFIAQFGDARTSEQRLNFSQAFNPPGTILGVQIGAWFIFSGVEHNAAEIEKLKALGTYKSYLHTEIMRVVPPYLAFGGVVLLCALLIALVKFPQMQSEEDGDQGRFSDLFQYPHLWFAVLAQFCNVGAQISSWSNLIPYMKAYTDVSERTAATYLTGTLIALMLGRFISTPLMRYISPAKMLGLYGTINILLMAIGMARPGLTGAWSIVISSFFLSIMFPTIFALGLKGLGANTKLAGSLLVMAVVGGAIFSPLLGLVAKISNSLAIGYVMPLIGYVVVTIYGWLSSRQKLATA